ncbi:hypothetical protein GCM10010182_57920 [Actinomadura cremea]|nr:hypothetical protein GCM10010182_57920 [Actinomadura cremea]
MSTRNLGLLTTTAVAALALGGFAGTALASAAPEPPGAGPAPAAADAPPQPAAAMPAMPEMPAAAPAGPEKPAAKPEKPAAKPEKPAAKDGTNLKACADGECEVVLRDGDEIKLDEKFGMEPIRVERKGTRVTFTLKGSGSMVTTAVDSRRPGATLYWNGLTLRPRIGEDGELVVKLSHRDAGKEKRADAKPAGKR